MKNIANRFLFFIIIGVICMLNSSSLAENGFKYTQYTAKDPELNLSIDYISGWLQREHKGPTESHTGLLFFEDKPGTDVFKAKISLNVQGILNTGTKTSALEEAVDELVSKRLELKEAKLLSRSKTSLLNEEAWDILLSYSTIDRLYSVKVSPLPVKERIIVFVKGNKIYSLRYQNTEQDFDKFAGAFNHIVSSLKFNENKQP